MDSVEFLVDSGLWYWRRCQRIFPRSVEGMGPRSVAYVSKCIQGASVHDRFRGHWCTSSGLARAQYRATLRGRGWILQAYCRRLHYTRPSSIAFGSNE